jgi:hypothetical protein
MQSNNDSRRMVFVLSVLVVLLFMLMAGCKPRYRASVSGRITDRNGNPIAGARVVVMDFSSDNDLKNTSSFSGENGGFYVPVHCERGVLSVYANGYASVQCSRPIIMGDNLDWHIELTKLVPVSGRVLDTNGGPVANRILNFMPLEEKLSDGSELRYYMNCARKEHCTDAQGIFNIPGVAPLKSKISVSCTDDHMRQRPVNAEVFDLTDAANRAGLEIIVNPPKDYSVSGHVRDAQGNPVPKVYVNTYTTPHGEPWWTWTDDKGAFCLEGLDGFGKDIFDIHFKGSTWTAGGFNITKTGIPLHTKDLEIVVP